MSATSEVLPFTQPTHTVTLQQLRSIFDITFTLSRYTEVTVNTDEDPEAVLYSTVMADADDLRTYLRDNPEMNNTYRIGDLVTGAHSIMVSLQTLLNNGIADMPVGKINAKVHKALVRAMLISKGAPL